MCGCPFQRDANDCLLLLNVKCRTVRLNVRHVRSMEIGKTLNSNKRRSFLKRCFSSARSGSHVRVNHVSAEMTSFGRKRPQPEPAWLAGGMSRTKSSDGLKGTQTPKKETNNKVPSLMPEENLFEGSRNIHDAVSGVGCSQSTLTNKTVSQT